MTDRTKKAATGWDALALLGLPPLLVFQGYVIMLLWAWHVVPVFGAPSLSLGRAVGLHTLWGLLRYRSPPDDGKGLADTTVTAVLLYSLALFIGWCAR